MADPPIPTVSGGMIDMESNTTLVQCYPAHQVVPAGEGPFPPIMVLHDRFGLAPYIKNVANRLAHAGFYAIAPDLYATPSSVAAVAPEYLMPTRSGSFDFSEEIAARERAALLGDDRAAAIVEQAIAYVAGRSKACPGGPGLLGFGTGARLAFLSACLFPDAMRGAVCFYPVDLTVSHPAVAGQPSPIDRAHSLAAPLLLFYGKVDSEIRSGERENVIDRLTKLDKDFSTEVFPEAGHDFFCSERDSYRIRASRVAWDQTLAFFRRHLGHA